MVARRPSSTPARASSAAPVQTEATMLVCSLRRRIQSRSGSFATSFRVPRPPGTSRPSSGGHSPSVASATALGPCALSTAPARSAIVTIRQRSSPRRMLPNAWSGPKTSSSSKAGKRRTPSVRPRESVVMPPPSCGSACRGTSDGSKDNHWTNPARRFRRGAASDPDGRHRLTRDGGDHRQAIAARRHGRPWAAICWKNAAARWPTSCGVRSSLCVANSHTWPKGSVTCP